MLGEYKRLVSSLVAQTEGRSDKKNTARDDNNDNNNDNGDNNGMSVSESASIRNEQIQRLLELQNYSAAVGYIPGEWI